MTLIQKYFNTWLDKRIPEASKHSLNHNNIFIFPAKFGWLFTFLCLLLFVLGTNYQNNLMLLLCYFLLAIFLINLLSSYINFARVNLQTGKCPEVFVGDNLHLPLWLNANTQEHAMPKGILQFNFKQKKPFAIVKIDADSFTNPVNLSMVCPTRGRLSLSRITVSSYYPMGLYKCWTHLAFPNHIVVYPKPIPCHIKLDRTLRSPPEKTGDAINSQSGYDDFSHLKSYQLGEPMYHVSWKHLAKGRGMVSKQFSSRVNQIGWLKLTNLPKGITSSHQADLLETELGKLCFQVIELSRQEQVFGLDLGKTSITPNSGSDHRKNCLHALAMYSSNESTK